MNPHPLRLLAVGYTIAASAAAGFQAATGALLGALLVFWLGGALLVLVLAATPGVSKPFRLGAEAALEAELRYWEEDRHAEAEAAARRRPDDHAAAG